MAERQRRDRAEAEARRASTLRIHLDGEPKHLNPLVEPDVATLRVADDTVFETLVRYEPPEDGAPTGTLEPGLAASFRVSPDGRELRFVLREGVTFHDGKPFSAVDAQFSIDSARSTRVRSPARWKAILADVISVEMWGPRDLRLQLRRPNGYVLRVLAEVPMLPAHVYAGDLNHHPKNVAPVGTGPFRFGSWQRGERIVLTRAEKYWGERPALESVEFVIEPDGARAITRAKRGELDVIPALSPAHHPEQASVQGIAGVFTPVRLRPAELSYLVVNTRRPPFDDARVRRAAALALDRGRIAHDIHDDLARPASGFVWPGGPGDAPAAPPPLYDFAAAGVLLDAAGWLVGSDGLRERAGQKLRIDLLVTADVRGDAERDLVIAALRKVGFAVDVRPGEPGYLVNLLKTGEFGAALLSYRGRVDDDITAFFSTHGKLNYGGFSSSSVDSACAALTAAYEPASRNPHAEQLGRLLAEAMPIIPITAPEPFGLVHGRVKGLVPWSGWFAIRRISF